MRRVVFFDGFCLIAIISLLFTIGFHIGNDEERYEKISFEIVLIPRKISGEPPESRATLIDGKYECTLKEFGEERIVILCEGYYSEAGFLLRGAKYVSANQPIKASQDWGYYDGRIRSVYRTVTRSADSGSDDRGE